MKRIPVEGDILEPATVPAWIRPFEKDGRQWVLISVNDECPWAKGTLPHIYLSEAVKRIEQELGWRKGYQISIESDSQVKDVNWDRDPKTGKAMFSSNTVDVSPDNLRSRLKALGDSVLNRRLDQMHDMNLNQSMHPKKKADF